MTTIDKSKPVLVTGATGYVAGWIVKQLLENGITVHAAVRNPQDEKKIAHLKKLAEATNGKILFFKADLLTVGSYAEAMNNCELVYHTASPFTSKYKDPQRDLIDPAVKGTANVLNQASKTSTVKRVVLTSSCAAIYTDCTDIEKAPGKILTEEIWNTTSSLKYQPYSYSKTLAEKEAWKIAQSQNKWDLVVINPSLVLGPALNPDSITSESFTILKQLGDGTVKSGVPNLGMGTVDVRDVADAHFKAGFTPSAKGRYITSGPGTTFLEIAKIVYAKYGTTYKIPNRALPKWLVAVFGPLVNRALTIRFVRNNVNHIWRADNSKSIKELGMSYRPLKETMLDSFKMLIDHKVI